MMTFKKFLKEKYVVGLIENITIEGVGEVEAKIDSGNGAFCVIHGIKLKYRKPNVTFETVNSKSLTLPVVDRVSINVGAGYIEERPVVELTIQIGDKKFENVKFSVGNRANNEQPVLIGKEFIMHSLDALIDVNGKHLSNKNIEVDYNG